MSKELKVLICTLADTVPVMLEGSTVRPCADCQAPLSVSRAGVKFLEQADSAAICLPCAIKKAPDIKFGGQIAPIGVERIVPNLRRNRN